MISIKLVNEELKSLMGIGAMDSENIDDISKGYLSTIVASIVNVVNKRYEKPSRSVLMDVLSTLTEEAQALRDHWTLDSLADYGICNGFFGQTCRWKKAIFKKGVLIAIDLCG